MQEVYYGAIQCAHHLVPTRSLGRVPVDRYRQSGHFLGDYIRGVGSCKQIEILADGQVQTIAELKNCTDNGLGYLADTLLPLRPFEGTTLIGIPEINAFTEPIEFAGAALERDFATNNALAHRTIAPVETYHKGGVPPRRHGLFLAHGRRLVLIVFRS